MTEYEKKLAEVVDRLARVVAEGLQYTRASWPEHCRGSVADLARLEGLARSCVSDPLPLADPPVPDSRFDRLATDAATLASLMLDCSTPALSREDREKLIRITNRAIDPQWMKASTPSPLTECEKAFNMFYRDTPGKRPIRGARWEAFKGGWEARDPK